MYRLPTEVNPMRVQSTILGVLLTAVGGPAAAMVINFENLPHLDNFTASRPSPFSIDGFTFADLGQSGHSYILWANNNPENAGGPGNNTLSQNQAGAVTTVSKVGGGSFTLNSLDAADVYNSTPVYYQGLSFPIFPHYRFTFTTAGGTTQQEIVLHDGQAGLETLVFNRIGLLSFSFQALNTDPFLPDFSHALQFDNVVINAPIAAVPLPASGSLMALIAAVCGTFARRARRVRTA